MAETKAMKVKLVLGATKGKLVRFSYLSVFEPRLNTESGNMEFSVAALIPKTNTEDLAAVRKAIKDLIADMWTSKGKPVPPKAWNPLRDGDTDTKQNGESYGAEAKGHYILNCKTGEDSAPAVVGTTRDADGKFIRLAKGSVKSGDWGRVGVSMGAYTKGTSGVGVYLTNLQLVQEGESLGSSRSAEDDFAAFADQEEDENPFG